MLDCGARDPPVEGERGGSRSAVARAASDTLGGEGRAST